MPAVPEEDFLAAVTTLVRADHAWVPRELGRSFYVRPFMVASEGQLDMRPAHEYLFAVIGGPVRPSFSAQPDPVAVWVTTDYIRAAAGGTGEVKCAGNYAGALLAQQQAASHGCQQVVWLDARERRFVEEMGGMNLFFVESTGTGARLVTPPLTGTLLPGITRDTILALAGRLGYETEQRAITVDEWHEACVSGRITEAFACGTAAVVAPVGRVRTETAQWTVGDGGAGKVTLRLREALLEIQHGLADDVFGWMHQVR